MQTVPNTQTHRNSIAHYAYYGDRYGTATLLNGSGYLFRAEGERTATLVSYKDANLLLLGLVELAEMQHDVDTILGGAAWIATHRPMEVA